MFISGLNRFFAKHGRKTFAAITGIIIISFVLYFSPGFDVFTLFGKKAREELLPYNLGKEEFQKAINSNLILTSMQMKGIPINDNLIQQLAYYKAPDWAFMTKVAEKRGFAASDKAVAEYIKISPSFALNGKFDKKTFDLFVKSITSFGFNVSLLENAVRKEIAEQRLSSAVKEGAIASEQEIDFDYNLLNGRTKAKLLKFEDASFISSVKADEPEIESFFNANKEKYFVEPESKAFVVRFNYIQNEEKAKSLISENDIADYYQRNKPSFTKDGKTKAIEDAKSEIRDILAAEKSSGLSLEDAQKFALSVYQKSLDSAEQSIKDIFIAEAKKQNIISVETDWFNAETKIIKNVGIEPALSAGISQLFMDQPLSEPVVGNKAVFVSLLTERKERRPAEFNEVKDKVVNDLKRAKARGIAVQKASEAALIITDKLSKGTKPQDIDELKTAQDIPLFSIVKPPEIPFSQIITELAIRTRTGGISEVRNTPEEPMETMFIFVEEKLPPEKTAESDVEKFNQALLSRKTNLAWFNFLNSLVPRQPAKKTMDKK
jgi:hypothetical protein